MTKNISQSVTPAASLRLSPVDHAFIADGLFPVSFVFLFEQRQDYERLRAGLSKALQLFFPLQGHLAVRADGSYEIAGRNTVELERCVLPKLPDATDSSAMQGLVRLVDPAPGAALARFVLYETPSASALSVSLSHRAGDGYALFMFLSSWAAFTRGEDTSVAPDHGRAALWGLEAAHAGDTSAAGVFRRTGFCVLSDPCSPALAALSCDELFISNAEVERVRSEIADGGSPPSVSSVLTALVARECVQRWGLTQGGLRLSTAHDVRRFLPEPAGRYFGNATCGISVEIERAQLEPFALADVARALHTRVRQFGAAEARDFIVCLRELIEQGGLAALQNLRIWHPYEGLLVSNISRIPLTSLDFGSGTPSSAHPLIAQRCAMVLSAADGYRVLAGRPRHNEKRQENSQ